MALCRSYIFKEIKCMHCVVSSQSVRNFTTSSQPCNESKARIEKLKIKCEPPKNIRNDYIGPPDTLSNLRPLLFHVPKSETELQKQYRQQRQEVQDWNHKYWAEHNTQFVEMKETFIKEKLEALRKENPDAPPTKLSAEQLSEFYRTFLDDNRKMHAQYNKEWYKKNFGLLLPAFRVKLEKLFGKQRAKAT